MLRSCTEYRVGGAEQPYHTSQLQQIAQYRRLHSFVLVQVSDCDVIAKLLLRGRDTGSERMNVSLPREQDLVTTDITMIWAPKLSSSDRPLSPLLDSKGVMIVRDGRLNARRIIL